MFQIVHIPHDAEMVEQMGTKFKFWYQDERIGRTLFKEGRQGTGENWAEKLACELAMMLGIPHATYDLACWRERMGVLSPMFMPPNARLIHGNEILGGRARPVDDAGNVNYYRERSHTATAVLGMLRASNNIHVPATYIDGDLTSAIDIFVGYLLFDAWIGNQDRHSENWGLVRLRDTLYLAPSYDHGSSMARHLSDEERQYRLTTKDRGASIDKFVEKARSALYPHASETDRLKPYLTVEAFEFAARVRPAAGNYWLEKLKSVSPLSVENVVDFVPGEIMSDMAKEFTKRLLHLNRDRLLALKIEK